MDNIREFNYWIKEVNIYSKRYGFSNGVELIENAIQNGKISYIQYLNYKKCFKLWEKINIGGGLESLINDELINNSKEICNELKNLI